MASTTARPRQTAAARKRAAAKPAAVGDGLDFEPIRIAADDTVLEERVTLFYIGEDEYTIPKHIPNGVALQDLRQEGVVRREMAPPHRLIHGRRATAHIAT